MNSVKINIINFLLFILLITLYSCDHMLEVTPTSTITSEGFWNKPGDAAAYLNGIYDKLRDVSNTTLYGEDRSDTFKPGNIGPVSEAWAQNLTAANAPSWLRFYNLIYHTNRLLKEIKGIDFKEESEKNRIKAEAHAIRAFIYFKLVRIWGKVPIVLTAANDFSSINSNLKARSPIPEVFDQINSDLNMALELFPTGEYFDKTKFTKPATYALKADVKMWTAKVLNGGEEDLNSALLAIEKIEESGVRLLDNFKQIFNSENENNDEVILGLFFEKEEQDGMYGDRLTTWGISIEAAVNKEEIAYTERNSARAVYAPSEKFVNIFDDADDRRNAAIVAAVSSSQDTILTCFNKYRGTEYSDDRYFDNDIIVYRYADIILLKAEALAALGRINKAVNELNRIKNRAGINEYVGSMDQRSIEKEILKERWRELFTELKRWYDLIRFYKGGTINIYEEVPNLNDRNDYPLYFPVDQDILNNNNLIEQTEGY